MGNFVATVVATVSVIGQIFCGVARWLDSFISSINSVTEDFVIQREYEIRNRDNPRLAGKYLACKKESKEIKKKEEEIGEQLSARDREWAERQCVNL